MSSVREVTPAEAQQLIADGAVLVDTREQHEWDAGHLEGRRSCRRSRFWSAS